MQTLKDDAGPLCIGDQTRQAIGEIGIDQETRDDGSHCLPEAERGRSEFLTELGPSTTFSTSSRS